MVLLAVAAKAAVLNEQTCSKQAVLLKQIAHIRTNHSFAWCCCCWRKGKRLKCFFFCFGKRNVWKVSASKGGEESSHSTLEPRWLLWGSIRFTTYVSCLIMINMTFEKENTPTGFVFVFRLFIRFRTLLVLFLPRYQSFSFTYHHLS